MTLDIKKITIPSQPGIYLMKDAEGKIIYIGKAKNLKNRVRSYFLKNQNYKTQKLVEKISDIEFVLTDNEAEAFLLESNMIKQYRPIFNIELKDQQRYTYLRLTDEEYPRLVVARRTRTGKFLGDGKIYGPFTSGSSKLLSIGSLRKAFKIRICKRLPKKACLEYHLGNCEAPCEFKEAQIRYAKHVSDLESILKGKDLRAFTKKLESEMRQASEQLQFERAQEIKGTLQRLGSLKTRQKMENVSGADEEYFGIKTTEQTAHIMTFKKINGVIRDSNKFSFDLVGDNSFSNFLYQYYTTNQIPPYVIVNEMPQNAKLLESLFSKSAGTKVKILVPVSGKRKEILDLILKNIDVITSKGSEPGLVQLKEELGLDDIPKVIECFDISNYGMSFAVGAMSRFVNGRPDKSGYRRFKIRTISGQDDFAMINEIIKRRYLRVASENLESPNLILIDGGKGQLSAAVSALQSLAMKIPCASLAKQNEEVFVPHKKEPIIMSRHHQGLQILQHARDEAHRFGIAYNRLLRMPKA
ncbi:MAG TPA: excinuclease ABC subunit UvrC [Candidatus Nitrosotenuis sp.]|nr:excinuclease ABC subunit UvrC [Candidatus Nitrosotenuis sp.]